MQKKHSAKGLDIFTGLENSESTHFGEIHTGDAWAPAVQHHIDQGKDEMPIGLIFHGDKSHFDNHGGLCTTPLSFTLSIFNEQARMSDKFWRPAAYLPDLSHERFGEGKIVQQEILLKMNRIA